MNLQDVLTTIRSGDIDDYLDLVNDAIDKRRYNKGVSATLNVEIGDKLRFVEEIRPKYLAGAQVELVQRLDKKAKVRMLETRGRFYEGIETTAPYALLAPING